MPAGISEKFANLAYLQVTESAANTITFAELKTGVGIFEKVALIIHMIEYQFYPASYALLLASDDVLDMGWSTSDSATNLVKDSPQNIDSYRASYGARGTPANYTRKDLPVVRDFTGLPGGGLIIPSASLYLGIQGTSLASAATGRSTLYFSYRSVKSDEYWELVEATRALT